MSGVMIVVGYANLGVGELQKFLKCLKVGRPCVGGCCDSETWTSIGGRDCAKLLEFRVEAVDSTQFDKGDQPVCTVTALKFL